MVQPTRLGMGRLALCTPFYDLSYFSILAGIFSAVRGNCYLDHGPIAYSLVDSYESKNSIMFPRMIHKVLLLPGLKKQN
ncbi:hypothetical protein BJX70DRAFT_378241 [Aspergillus crustosus]